MTQIGLLIYKSRTELNLTQNDIAIKCGMCAQYISNIERGICLPPKAKLPILVKILKLKRYRIEKALTADYLARLRK